MFILGFTLLNRGFINWFIKMSMEWEDAREFCQFRGGGGVQGGGRIIIQSVLGQSRLNTFSQRAKHKVMGETGNLMETEVAFVDRFENPTNEWCSVWLQRWKGATPAPSWAHSKMEQKKRKLNRDGCLVRRCCFGLSVATRQRAASSDGESISMALRKRKHIRRASTLRLISFGHCSRIYFPNPIWSCFSICQQFHI